MNKQQRVIIVDDEADVREGLEAWLSADYLTASFDSAESFLQAIEDFEFEDGLPTCMLLDFQMPGMNGVELQSVLQEINIEFPIVFMSGNAKQADIINAWQGGAVDFLLKPFSAQKVTDYLIKAFAKTHQGRRSDVVQQDQEDSNIVITQREAQVLLLLGKGYQQSEVAQKLGISVRTVKMYRNFLKTKLNLHSLIELARYYDKHHVSIRKIAGDRFVES